MAWAHYDGDVAAIDFETADCNLVDGLEFLEHARHTYECLKVETSLVGS